MTWHNETNNPWGGLCLLAIATDDAFFAALYALIATTEWHDQDEWSRP